MDDEPIIYTKPQSDHDIVAGCLFGFACMLGMLGMIIPALLFVGVATVVAVM